METQRVDHNDLRYDVFNSIYELLTDNIELRLTGNRSLKTILELNTKKIVQYNTAANAPKSSKLRENETKGRGITTPGANESMTMGFGNPFAGGTEEATP